jgi:hypothetical protein
MIQGSRKKEVPALELQKLSEGGSKSGLRWPTKIKKFSD